MGSMTFLKNATKKLKGFLYTQRYVIGFIEDFNFNQSSDDTFSKIKWVDLQGYRKGWFADPFILSADESQIVVLAEEYLYSTKLGRIVRLSIDRNTYRLLKIEPILELPTHLSFPIYIRENGKTYLYPENYQGGALKIYEYDDSTRTLSNPITLVSEPLLDSQILKIDGTYYIFAVKYKTGLQKDTKDLIIYKASSLLGPFIPHQSIETEHNEERGAGTIFVTKYNKIIRPTQNCEYDYGKEVIFKQLELENDAFSEIEVGRISADGNKKKGLGIHTFNQLKDLTVVDGRGFRYVVSRWIKTFINRLSR